MFTAEFEPAEVTSRRGTPRTPVSLDAQVGRGRMDRTLCRVTDISIQGARISSYSSLKRGAAIWLTLPIVGMIAATIVWADEFEAGCLFRDALDEATFKQLAALG